MLIVEQFLIVVWSVKFALHHQVSFCYLTLDHSGQCSSYLYHCSEFCSEEHMESHKFSIEKVSAALTQEGYAACAYIMWIP